MLFILYFAVGRASDCYSYLHNYLVSIYLKERHTNTHTHMTFYLLDQSSNKLNSHSWIRPTPGSQNSVQVSHRLVGIQVRGSLSTASHGAHSRRLEPKAEPRLEPKHADRGCSHPEAHLTTITNIHPHSVEECASLALWTVCQPEKQLHSRHIVWERCV